MKKKMVWMVLSAVLPYLLLVGGIIMLFVIIIGGDADKPIPIPCDEKKAQEYYSMYQEAGAPWDLVMLVDFFLADKKGDKDISAVNPLVTSLNFCTLETVYYTWEWDEDDEGNILDTGEWIHDSTKYSEGYEEICKSLSIDEHTTAPGLEASIKDFDEKYYRADRRMCETTIYGAAPYKYKYIIETYYGAAFSERDIDDITEIYQSKYIHYLYIDSVGIYEFLYDPDMEGAPPSGDFASPIPGNWRSVVYCEFKGYPGHTGIDLAVPSGTRIYASQSGKVFKVRTGSTGYGYYVVISHGGGLSTLYAHCSELLVREGQEVSQGDIIALSGNTGNSTGPHLHFEIIVNGVPQNPRDLL